MWGGLCGARFSLLKEMFPALFIVCVCVCLCVCVCEMVACTELGRGFLISVGG